MITVADEAIRPTVRALVRSSNNLDSLFCFQDGDSWRPLHSHEVSSYIAANAGGHFTAKEFRTWNATVLMALFLANGNRRPPPRPPEHHRRRHPWCSDLAGRHADRGTQVLHRPPAHQPVRVGRPSARDPRRARHAAGRGRSGGRRRCATRRPRLTVARHFQPGVRSRLLDPLLQLRSLRLLQAGHLDVAGPVGRSERGRGSKSAPPRKTTFTETS